jgi:peptidoglycan/xylan/chitin deacetylase (PgdA/CDA1 family)
VYHVPHHRRGHAEHERADKACYGRAKNRASIQFDPPRRDWFDKCWPGMTYSRTTIQTIHGARFSHELPVTSNIRAIGLLIVVVFSLVACSSSPNQTANPAEAFTRLPIPSPSATTIAIPTTLDTPEVLPAGSTALPSSTPTVTPSPTASPTPFLTPPSRGQPVFIPILMYHHLEQLAPSASLTLKTWTVSPSNFRDQLDYLMTHGYHTISFSQLDAFFEESRPLPLHPVILTFDDGWSDDYTVAFPALNERGMVGTFFVPTSYAGAPGGKLLSWDQIAEMDAHGMEFGGHTINHADLEQLSKDEALRQLQVSKAKMEEKLGHSTIAFSYPFGTYNADVVAEVRQVGYRVAVGLCCGYKLRADILLTLPRIRISYDDRLSDLARKLPTDSNE